MLTLNYADEALIQYALNNQTVPSFVDPVVTDSLCSALEFIDSVLPGGILDLLAGGSFSDVVNFVKAQAKSSGRSDVAKLASILDGSNGGTLPNGQRCPF
jgi:hypothetical protein